MPDDFEEGEYFKISVEATRNTSDRDQSLPFDIHRALQIEQASPSASSIPAVRAFESYSSEDEYVAALRVYLTQSGPGTVLALRQRILTFEANSSAVFVSQHCMPDPMLMLTAWDRSCCMMLGLKPWSTLPRLR